MKILQTKNLTKYFGGVTALNRVDLVVNKGDILGLIGPNGSGKTTLFNCITGVLKPSEGEVIFMEKNITGFKPHIAALMGLSRTFQIIHLFPKMTVLENALISNQQHQGEDIISSILRTKKIRKKEAECMEKSLKALELIGLSNLMHEKAQNLSYGQQKLLEIAMAIIPDPKIVLLDEPTSGVNPVMINTILEYIKNLNKEGQTFVVIEHNMDVIMRISERVVCLDYGNIIAEGDPEEVRNNKDVIDAYFGV